MGNENLMSLLVSKMVAVLLISGKILIKKKHEKIDVKKTDRMYAPMTP